MTGRHRRTRPLSWRLLRDLAAIYWFEWRLSLGLVPWEYVVLFVGFLVLGMLA
jgi:hypothetical protein